MKKECLNRLNRLVVVSLIGFALLGYSELVAQDGKKAESKKDLSSGKKRDSRPGGMRIGNDVWSSLTKEERDELRVVLRRVWSDPEVQSAREEVKNAAENYQKAVKDAVGKESPDVAKLLVKVQSENQGNMKKFLPSRPPHSGGSKGDRRGPPHILMGPPGFLESLSKEQRQRFLKAQAIAKETPEVKDALKALEKIRHGDDVARKERLKAFTRLRKVSTEALLAVDPELKDLLPKKGAPNRGAKARAEKKKRHVKRAPEKK